MPCDTDAKQEPASVAQLAAALRLGEEDAYRVRLANALLGAAQIEALLADAIPLSPEPRTAAYEQQLSTAGAADDPAKRIAFLRWRTLRISGPLRAGPIRTALTDVAAD